MRFELRPRTALALLLVVLVVLTTGSAAVGALSDGDDGADEERIETVALEDGSELWPYTSRAANVEQRTLAINIVVYGNPTLTEAMLRQSVVADWQDVGEDEQDIAPAEDFDVGANESTVAWGGADGATRFVYVETPEGDAFWMDETYQLRDGDYLGERHHVRAYVDPHAGNWTAMQAHQEHWDWFHLRHTVQSIERSQSYVDEEFVDRVYVEDLQRDRWGNDGSSDSDGWVTVVRIDERFSLALALLVVGSVGSVGLAGAREWLTETRTDETVRDTAGALFVVSSIVAFYIAVRFGAIGLENLFPDADPKLIVAGFYPLLVCGMPIIAYLTARRLDTIPAFAAATVGFTLAIMLDYTYLDVSALPIDTIVHRLALGIAIGFIAAGASAAARDHDVVSGHVRTGVLLWVAAVLIPLLQFV